VLRDGVRLPVATVEWRKATRAHVRHTIMCNTTSLTRRSSRLLERPTSVTTAEYMASAVPANHATFAGLHIQNGANSSVPMPTLSRG
jgi:hypothetical protein